MNELIKRLKQLGIKLVVQDMDGYGYYLPALKTMFVDEKLNENEAKYAIYHELAHHLDHKDYAVLYNKPVYHYKMESEANDYAIKQLIEENGGIYNYSQLINTFNVTMGWDTQYYN